jgi:hypothetical protein
MRKLLVLAVFAVLMPLGCSSSPRNRPPESVQVGDIHKKEVQEELRARERERQRQAVEGEGTSDSE